MNHDQLREHAARALCESEDVEHGDPDWTVYPRGMSGGYEQRWEAHLAAVDAVLGAAATTIEALPTEEKDLLRGGWRNISTARWRASVLALLRGEQ